MPISAVIKFYRKDEGGRITPPKSGYKPHLRVNDEYTSCIITPEDEKIDTMEFGIEYSVNIELVFQDIYKKKIFKGMKVELYEGSKLIGIGSIADVK